jgi:hypothetical protein
MKRHLERLRFALTTPFGTLVCRVHGDYTSAPVVFRGEVLAGTGEYTGARGHVTMKPIKAMTSNVVIRATR